MQNLNIFITHLLQSHRSPIIDLIMVIVSSLGYVPYKPILIVFVFLLLLFFKRYKQAFLIFVVSLGTQLLEVVVKRIISEPRPSTELINYIYRVEKSTSFPSGHVLFYTAFFGFLFYLAKKEIVNRRIRVVIEAVSFLLIVLVGISRIYLGAHWFTDVIGGYSLGLGWLFICILMYNSWIKDEKSKN